MAARKKKAAKKKKATKRKATRQRITARRNSKTGKTVDWDRARVAWTTTPGMSFEELAEQFGCSGAAVRARASKEGWQGDRDEYLEELIATTRNLVATRHAEAVGKQLVAAVNQMEQLRALVMRRLIARAEADEEVFEKAVQEQVEVDILDGKGRKTGRTKIVKKTMKTRPVPVDTPFIMRILDGHLRLALAALGMDGGGAGGASKIPEATDVDFEIR